MRFSDSAASGKAGGLPFIQSDDLDKLRKLSDEVREGCLLRLRPVLMGAPVAALGFIPLAVIVASA